MTTLKYALVLLAGCGLPLESELTGPTIRVYVDPPTSSSVDSTYTDASIPMSNGRYEFTVSITTSDGEERTSKGFETYTVTEMRFTMTVEGETIPDSPLASDMSIAAVTWTRRDPVVLPATAMGKQVVIHAQGTDAQGLDSNVVDWSVLLR